MNLNITTERAPLSICSLPDEAFNHIFSKLKLQEVLLSRLINKKFSERASSFWWKTFFHYPLNGFRYNSIIPLKYSVFLSIQKNIKVNSHKFEIFSDPLKNDEDERALLGDMHLNENQLAVVDSGSGIYSGIKIWNLNKRKISHVIRSFSNVGRLVKLHNEFVYSVSNSSIYSSKNNIEVWNLKNGTFQDNKHATGIFLQSEKDKIQELIGHKKNIQDIQVCSSAIYSSSRDKTIKVWDREKGKPLLDFNTNSPVERILIDHHLIYGIFYKTLLVCDYRSGSAVNRKTLSKTSLSFTSMNRNNQELYLGTDEGKILLWDIRADKISKIYSTKCFHTINDLVLEGDYLFSHSCNSPNHEDDKEVIEVFEKKSGKSLHILKETSFSHKIKGWKETIEKIQMHQGTLYTSSHYLDGGDAAIRDWFGGRKSMIKSWNFK